MQHNRIPITREGYEKLKKEIDQIKGVERPKIIREIEEARAHGDLSENAEYHAAKEKQSHLTGRLHELEDKLGRAEIIDPARIADKTRVAFGAKVKLLDVHVESEVIYQIVGEYEADINAGRISLSSPIGRALIGKALKASVSVSTPKGIREFEIIEIDY